VPDATDHRAAFEAVRSFLEAELLESDERIPTILAAYIAKEHVFLLGPPGVAKTMAIQLLADTLNGAAVFDYLMSKFSTPEELFGPYSIAKLQEDRYVRMGTGMLQEAQFASLDEIWKANSAILNHLLRLTNERQFHNGTDGAQDVPLEMVIAASNELPQDESLAALYDRLLVRLYVGPVKRKDSRRTLVMRAAHGYEAPPAPVIEPEHLDTIRAEVEKVRVPDTVADKLVTIWSKVDEKGIYVSPRRWMQVVKLLKSYTWVQGNDVASDDDLMVLPDCLWSEYEQRPTLVDTILQETNPQGIKAKELLDSAIEAYDAHGGDNDALLAAARRVKKVHGQILKLPQDHATVSKCTERVAQLRDDLKQKLADLV